MTTHTPQPDDLVTTSGAARILELSESMVRILAARGVLPSLQSVSGTRWYRRRDCERVKAERDARLANEGAS